jgi:hypothetical protein
MQIFRAADRIATPWKNGGGITREVAIFPPDSGFDNFDWRISIAEVREAGPFSMFPGIDRTMMILQGRLALTFADREVNLDTTSQPFAFPGDVACSGAPIDGAVMDLNVMTRRGRCTATVARVSGEMELSVARHGLLLAAASGEIRVGVRAISLAPLDALLIADPGGQRIQADTRVFAISLA